MNHILPYKLIQKSAHLLRYTIVKGQQGLKFEKVESTAKKDTELISNPDFSINKLRKFKVVT